MLFRNWKVSVLTIAILCHVLLVATAFFIPKTQWQVQAFGGGKQDDARHHQQQQPTKMSFPWARYSSSSSSSTERNVEQNRAFIGGLMSNLGTLCDKYIMSGSPKTRERVFNVLDQIAAESVEEELIRQSVRMVKRAGVPMHKTYLEKYQNELGKTDAEERRQEASKRKEWEQQYQRQQQQQETTSQVGSGVANNLDASSSSTYAPGKSALSQRMSGQDGRPDLFTPTVLDPDAIATIAQDKKDLQNQMENGGSEQPHNEAAGTSPSVEEASARVSEIIARAGSGDAFEGQALGIGGLDDVLVEIKRRIWTPLAAPPKLLEGEFSFGL
jgi:hypothetical protein